MYPGSLFSRMRNSLFVCLILVVLLSSAGVGGLPPASAAPVVAAPVNLLQDPGFEAYTPNPYWAEYSTNYGTVLCTIDACGDGGGTAGPRTGLGWAWFGGIAVYEEGYVSQSVIIPAGSATLSFYFWIGAAAAGSGTADMFAARIDGVTIFSANATQINSYPSYTLVSVDVSAFANGATHTIMFYSVIDGQNVNFNLDDVALTVTSGQTFSDVPTNYWAWTYIESLYSSGITQGCATDPLRYCPENSVSRAQMAVFLERGLHGAGFVPPPASGTVFVDVPVSYWAASWIEEVYWDGITVGCTIPPPLTYCPENSVTRAQMAVFLLKSMYGRYYLPPAASGIFADVPLSHWATPWIEQLYAEGITTGCLSYPLSYCPENPVTRAQMAVFLVRTFNLP